MTPTTVKALTILRDAGHPLTALDFAAAMWPDSPGWSVTQNVGGRGAARGAGMQRAANGLLGRLYKQGLVRKDYRGNVNIWTLNRPGRAALVAALPAPGDET